VARAKAVFRERLVFDLKAAGFRIREPAATGDWKIVPPKQAAQEKRLRELRMEQVSQSRDFIERMESRGALELVGDPTIDPLKITPQVKICETDADHAIFRYAKLFQRVPTTNRVGRQVRCLVYDVGQTRSVLMGVFELTSGAYTLGSRDNYLNWSGGSRKAKKDKGLRRIMDLATVVALPPYNIFLGGKLIASLAFSDVVTRELRRRYRTDLLGVIATSATGLHCAILNRIGLRPGGLFRRIGETSGYSTTGFNPSTLSAARAFLPSFVSAPEGEFTRRAAYR
jgi:hypothetical protein